MQAFNIETFRDFLGQPIFHENHSWGKEQRFFISESSLSKYGELLADTIYQHHSSFNFADEIAQLGYPQTAQAMRQRNSGNPIEHRTQMGNLGEVLGAEFTKALLEFDTVTFPKRLNPNTNQSMKGVDIIGLRDSNRPTELLIGEAKTMRQYDKRAVKEAYDHLVDLQKIEASRILRFMKETLILRGARQEVANVDRHMAHNVPRRHLIILITQSLPEAPFAIIEDIIEQGFNQVELAQLFAVHIQICGLKNEMYAWLDNLFNS
jgi:hypothetical protein